ncbi:MAG: sugar transferase [Candidatus Izemoplasmatales bacterium]
MYRKVIKRLFDFLLSFIGIIVASPFLLLIALAIKLDSKGPVIFRQNRVGKHKKFFNIYKFRTMKIDTPKNTPTHLLEHPEQYITRVGKFLRRSSLDEVPQIFNILLGQMSIIGPRPALWNQDDLIAERDKYGANDVTPGLTGLAQVKGRDALEIPIKARYDGVYASHITFIGDTRLFFKTIRSVFKSEGVVEGGTGALNQATEKKD